jgi:hypothetical protein
MIERTAQDRSLRLTERLPMASAERERPSELSLLFPFRRHSSFVRFFFAYMAIISIRCDGSAAFMLLEMEVCVWNVSPENASVNGNCFACGAPAQQAVARNLRKPNGERSKRN